MDTGITCFMASSRSVMYSAHKQANIMGMSLYQERIQQYFKILTIQLGLYCLEVAIGSTKFTYVLKTCGPKFHMQSRLTIMDAAPA